MSTRSNYTEAVNERRLKRFVDIYVGCSLEEAKRNCYYVGSSIFVFKKADQQDRIARCLSSALCEELFCCMRLQDGGDCFKAVLQLDSRDEFTPELLDQIINSSNDSIDVKILAERVIWCVDALGSKARLSTKEEDEIVEKLLMFMRKHPGVMREWWLSEMIEPWKNNKYFPVSRWMLQFLWESPKLKECLDEYYNNVLKPEMHKIFVWLPKDVIDEIFYYILNTKNN